MLRHLWDTFGVLLKLFLRLRHTFEVEVLLNPFWNLCDAPLKCCWCLFMPFFWCWCAFDILLKPCWFPFDWKIVLMLTIWNPFESMIEAFLRPFWSTFWCHFETRLKLRHLWNHFETLLMPFWGWSVFETIWNLCKCWDTFELVLKPFWEPFEVLFRLECCWNLFEELVKPFWDPFETLLIIFWSPFEIEALLKPFLKPFRSLFLVPLWSPFGILLRLRPFWSPFETLLRHFWDPFETLLRPLWDPFETILRPFWSLFDALQRTFWSSFESVWFLLMPLWNPFEALLRPFEVCWDTFYVILKHFGEVRCSFDVFLELCLIRCCWDYSSVFQIHFIFNSSSNIVFWLSSGEDSEDWELRQIQLNSSISSDVANELFSKPVLECAWRCLECHNIHQLFSFSVLYSSILKQPVRI